MSTLREECNELITSDSAIDFLELCLSSICDSFDLNYCFRSRNLGDLHQLVNITLTELFYVSFNMNELSEDIKNKVIDNVCELYIIDTLKRNRVEGMSDLCIMKDSYTIDDVLCVNPASRRVFNYTTKKLSNRDLATFVLDLFYYKGLILCDEEGNVYSLFDIKINNKIIHSVFNSTQLKELLSISRRGKKIYVTNIMVLYRHRMYKMYSKLGWTSELLLHFNFQLIHKQKSECLIFVYEGEVYSSRFFDRYPDVFINSWKYSKDFLYSLKMLNKLDSNLNAEKLLSSFYLYILTRSFKSTETFNIKLLNDMCFIFLYNFEILKMRVDKQSEHESLAEVNEIVGYVCKLDMSQLYSVKQDIYVLHGETLQLRITPIDVYLYDTVKGQRLHINSIETFIDKIQYDIRNSALALLLYSSFIQGQIGKSFRVCRDIYRFNNKELIMIGGDSY